MKQKELFLSINDLNVPLRVRNILKGAGIKNVGELNKLGIIQLLCLWGIGHIAVTQIDTALNSLGLKLKQGSFRNLRRYMDFWKKRNARVD